MADRTPTKSRPKGQRRGQQGGGNRGYRNNNNRGRRGNQNRRDNVPVLDVEKELEEFEANAGDGPEIAIGDLKKMKMEELHDLAKELEIESYSGLKKQDLIFAILQKRIEAAGSIYGEGTLEEALYNARLRLDFCSVTGHAHWPDMPEPNARTQPTIDYHRDGFARLREKWVEATG